MSHEKRPLLSAGPAFTSLTPRYPTWEDLAAESAHVILENCPSVDFACSLGAPGTGPEGRYVVRDTRTAALRFLKIFPSSILPLQKHATDIAQYLAVRGVPTPVPVGDIFHWDNQHNAVLFPYIDARFSNGTPDEIEKIGKNLALVHLGLREYYNSNKAKSEGALLHASLLELATDASLGNTHTRFSDLISRASAAYSEAMTIMSVDAQMIHGDCNFTNFLFEKTSNQQWVLDFEESLTTWLSPWYDLAVVIQRFVLIHQELLPLAPNCVTALIRGYGNENISPMPCAPVKLCLAPVYRSVMLLCLKARTGLRLPDAEWEKFAYLERVVWSAQPILEEIFSCH